MNVRMTRALWVVACVFVASGCSGGGGSAANDPPPDGTFTITPAVIAPGGQATLHWEQAGASTCQAGGAWTGVQPVSGDLLVAPADDNVYTYTLSCTGPNGTTGHAVTLGVTPSAAKIKHVVVIFQENRTPDNLFHGLPGADIANSGINSKGQVIPLEPEPLAIPYDLDHSHVAFVHMYDNGKMDGADKIYVACIPNTANCPPPNPQFKYVDPADVAPYFNMAERYTFADRMFQTNQGPSMPAHMFLISGTSAPSPDSPDFVSENPSHANEGSGCHAGPDVQVVLIDPLGKEGNPQYPCFEERTLIDELDAAGLDWRYYAPFARSIWVSPNAIRHIALGPDFNKVIIPQTTVLQDIATGKLAPVTWVMPSGRASDHAYGNNNEGPSWVSSIVNAIGNSAYWSDTAIFITWDDWGGWYDHVAPKIYNSYEYGFRVPLIVVSPYAKNAYVSHTTHDFGSMLKFIEENFSLPSLGTADERADDLADCFDFAQTPTPFQTVPSKFSAQYFLTDTRPPTPPDDD